MSKVISCDPPIKTLSLNLFPFVSRSSPKYFRTSVQYLMMWKLITISCILILVEATDIQNFYGDWIQVAEFPSSTLYQLGCYRSSLAIFPEDVPCSCDDGRNATLVLVKTYPAVRKNPPPGGRKMRILVVDSPAEATPALNVNCSCGVEEFTTRGVARLVDNNYFTMNLHPLSYAESDKNYIQLFAKTVEPFMKLVSDVAGIEEVSGRRGAFVCSAETLEPPKL